VVDGVMPRSEPPPPDTGRPPKIPAPQIDQVGAHAAQGPVARLCLLRPPARGVLRLRAQEPPRIAHRANGPGLEQRFDSLGTRVKTPGIAHGKGDASGPNDFRHTLAASDGGGHALFPPNLLSRLGARHDLP